MIFGISFPMIFGISFHQRNTGGKLGRRKFMEHRKEEIYGKGKGRRGKNTGKEDWKEHRGKTGNISLSTGQ